MLAACDGSDRVAAVAPSTTATPTGLVGIGSGLSGPSGMAAAVVATGMPNVAALAMDAEGRLWRPLPHSAAMGPTPCICSTHRARGG
jgi:hypothetical protein